MWTALDRESACGHRGARNEQSTPAFDLVARFAASHILFVPSVSLAMSGKRVYTSLPSWSFHLIRSSFRNLASVLSSSRLRISGCCTFEDMTRIAVGRRMQAGLIYDVNRSRGFVRERRSATMRRSQNR